MKTDTAAPRRSAGPARAGGDDGIPMRTMTTIARGTFRNAQSMESRIAAEAAKAGYGAQFNRTELRENKQRLSPKQQQTFDRGLRQALEQQFKPGARVDVTQIQEAAAKFGASFKPQW